MRFKITQDDNGFEICDAGSMAEMLSFLSRQIKRRCVATGDKLIIELMLAD